MKYTLIIALFAAVAIASTCAYPTGEEETPKAEAAPADTEVKVAEKAGEDGTKADDAKADETKAEETKAGDVADDDKCEPGTSFPRECNTCICPPSGARSLSACTLKLCLPETPEEKEPAKSE